MTRLFTIIIIALYAYTLLSTISVLLLENRNPAKSLSWMLVLLFIPVIGMFFYLLLGQDYRKKKIISKKSIRSVTDRPVASFDINKLDTTLMNENQLNLIKMLYKNSEAAGYAFNRIEVLSDGESTFNAVFDAIRNAKDHVHIEFFIFDDDKISNQLRELLIQKATEGVRVRMIYDYWGSFDLSKKYLKSLKDAGVYVRPFLPFRWRISRSSKINYRNHRKLIIVDGKTGFTGGLNVADRYIYGNSLGKWRDTFVRMEGSVVHGLQLLFMVDWYFVDQKLIDGTEYFPAPPKFEQNMVQLVNSGPDTDWEAIMQGIALAITSATKYIYIHSPYFMPTDVIATCIQMAALSGVDVRLMIPDRSDSRLSDASTFSYLGQALEAGVRVFRYKKGFLHSKALVIDDFISIVGSCNLDERSFVQNFEANAFIYDPQTALRLKELYLNDMDNCEELTFGTWTNRKRRQKLKESFARLFSPLM
ncbi:MAG: cardiolipin synthase [Bacteroidota bacterium]|nr:cardiolipin synthase [Bacteroidota bacterium]